MQVSFCGRERRRISATSLALPLEGRRVVRGVGESRLRRHGRRAPRAHCSSALAPPCAARAGRRKGAPRTLPIGEAASAPPPLSSTQNTINILMRGHHKARSHPRLASKRRGQPHISCAGAAKKKKKNFASTLSARWRCGPLWYFHGSSSCAATRQRHSFWRYAARSHSAPHLASPLAAPS